MNTGLTQADSYRDKVESLEGQELLAKSFPAGASAATDVIVPNDADVAAVTRALEQARTASRRCCRPTSQGPQGRLLNVVLEPEPYSTEAFNLIPSLRGVGQGGGRARACSSGGPSAIEYDVRQAAARDTRVIIPIALVVVFAILILLLRSLVAPLLLIGTVILSFAAALGISLVVFDVLFGFPGVDPSFPLYAFIFLVALGIDYNIFLMARVREETLRHGTRQGMLRGLAVTGGVITSAGIVLAGTFSVLALLPLVFLTEIGFVIAFGVLLDTFIVRSVLVPALRARHRPADLVAVAARARGRRRRRATSRPASRARRSSTAAPRRRRGSAGDDALSDPGRAPRSARRSPDRRRPPRTRAAGR